MSTGPFSGWSFSNKDEEGNVNLDIVFDDLPKAEVTTDTETVEIELTDYCHNIIAEESVGFYVTIGE